MKIWNSQSVPDLEQTGTSREFQNPRHYSQCPKPLTLDKSVSDGAFRVFSLLALQNYKEGKKTNIAQISTRELAESKGCSHTTIRRWLGELEHCGQIEKLGKARGKATYRLTSPVFEYRVAVVSAPGAVVDVSSAQLPEIRAKKAKCPKCKRIAHIASTSGVCDACLNEWVNRKKAQSA